MPPVLFAAVPLLSHTYSLWEPGKGDELRDRVGIMTWKGGCLVTYNPLTPKHHPHHMASGFSLYRPPRSATSSTRLHVERAAQEYLSRQLALSSWRRNIFIDSPSKSELSQTFENKDHVISLRAAAYTYAFSRICEWFTGDVLARLIDFRFAVLSKARGHNYESCLKKWYRIGVVNLALLKCRKLRREDQETSDWIVSRILYCEPKLLVSVVVEISILSNFTWYLIGIFWRRDFWRWRQIQTMHATEGGVGFVTKLPVVLISST